MGTTPSSSSPHGQVGPQFRLDERNVDAIAEIYRRLDGLPLAIDGRLEGRLLPQLDLLPRLHEGLGLVGAGPSDAPLSGLPWVTAATASASPPDIPRWASAPSPPWSLRSV